MAIIASPRIHILAGPNGAGKTTFAASSLVAEEGLAVFIDADRIASRLAPSSPEHIAIESGRLMLEAIRASVARGESFGFETTLAGRVYARWIPGWRASGYHVRLSFLSLPSPESAIRRVAARVRSGGHDVPEAVIRRRFRRGLINFHMLYKPLVSSWVLYSGVGPNPVIVDVGANP